MAAKMCTAGIPSHHDSAAPGFLPEWRQNVPGAEQVLGGSQRAPGWEALGGLSDQAHSSRHAVTACTERRRLPAGQPRGDDVLLLCGRAHELHPLHNLVSEER